MTEKEKELLKKETKQPQNSLEAKEDRFQSVLRDIFKWEEDLKETLPTEVEAGEPQKPLYEPIFADKPAEKIAEPKVEPPVEKAEEPKVEPPVEKAEEPKKELLIEKAEEPKKELLIEKAEEPKVELPIDKVGEKEEPFEIEPFCGTLFESEPEKETGEQQNAKEAEVAEKAEFAEMAEEMHLDIEPEEVGAEELEDTPVLVPTFTFEGSLEPAYENVPEEPKEAMQETSVIRKPAKSFEEASVQKAKEQEAAFDEVPFDERVFEEKVFEEDAFEKEAFQEKVIPAPKPKKKPLFFAKGRQSVDEESDVVFDEELEDLGLSTEQPLQEADMGKVKPKPSRKKVSREPNAFFASPAWQIWLRPVAVLGAICLVASLLLSLAQMVTLPYAERNSIKLADDMRRQMIEQADSFALLAMDPLPADVIAVYEAKDKEEKLIGYVIDAQGNGYGGKVPASVAFDLKGTMLGVRFWDNQETPGLGKKIITDTEFGGQFADKEAKEKALDEIDTVTGATLSSMAGLNAVNAAINCYKLLVDTGEEPAPAYALPDGVLATLWPEASTWQALQVDIPDVMQALVSDDGVYVIVTKGKGMSDMYAAVALNNDGVIVGLWLDTSKETEGIGKGYSEDDAYKGQFIGQTNADGVDTVAKATSTTQGIKDMVNKAVAALPAVKQAPPLSEDLSNTMPVADKVPAYSNQRRRYTNE